MTFSLLQPPRSAAGRAHDSRRSSRGVVDFEYSNVFTESWPIAARTFSSVVHFTPTHASWMNMVEIWFGIIERQAIHRDTFTSVPDLNSKIRAFITGWNDRAHPFTWTKTPDQILAKANRQKTSDAGH